MLHIAARDNGETSEIGFYRNSTNQFNRDGVFEDGDFSVHEAGTPDNTVRIDAGDIIIGIDSPDTDQPDYYYHGWSTAEESITITSNSSGSTRIDIVVAYVDLSVQDDSASDNPGALKLKSVEGTAGSGAPTESDIQTSVGSGNPWVNLAEVTAADSFSSITNSEIADMRPKADTSWRRHNDVTADHVVSGYSVTQDSGLDGTISAGEAYVGERKVDKPEISHTFSTNVDTYVDLPKTAKPTNNDDFTYSEVANDATAPAVASGEMRIAVVVTDGSGITSVTTSGEDNDGNKVRPTSPVIDGSVGQSALDGNTNQFKVGNFTAPASTGNHSVTGVGFKPKVVEFNLIEGGTNQQFGYGVMDENGNQWAFAGTDNGSNVTSENKLDACHFWVSAGGSDVQLASFVSMDSDGFTINFSAVNGGEIGYKAYA